MEELALGGSGTPDGEVGGVGFLGFMGLAEESGEDVRGFEVEVVAGSVEVGGHEADGVEAVLLAVGLAHFDTGDFGDGVPLVGGFEWAGEKRLFADGLRGETGVDAGGAEKGEFGDVVAPGGVDNVGLDGEVVVNEFGGVEGVSEDSTDFGGGEEDEVGAVGGEEVVGLGLVAEVELSVGGGKEAGESCGLQSADEGCADESAGSRRQGFCWFWLAFD